MKYEAIKKTIDKVISKSIWLTKLFFSLIDFHLLRTWHIHRELHNFFKTCHKDNIHVLDAGCGFSQYSYFVLKNYYNTRLIAIDSDEDHIIRARHFFEKTGYHEAEFILGDITKYVNPDHFDLIMAVDVMEHITEDEVALRNFFISLKAGGMLIISTPSDKGGSDVDSDHKESFIEEHVRNGYSIKEIRDKLLASGFERIDAKYTYGGPGKISWRLSMKYPIILWNISKAFLIILPVYFIIVYPVCIILNFFDITFRHSSGTGLLVTAFK